MARPGDDDDVPWLAEGVREERSTLVPRARLFGGTLLALLFAVLVGLGVYLASGHKSDGSGGYARPEDAPLIAADAGPYKIAPDNPGGAQITGIDDSVAAVAGGTDQGSAIAADAAEEPITRPLPGAPVASTSAAPPTDLLPPTVPPSLPNRAIAAAPVIAPKPATAPPATPAVAPTAKVEAAKPKPPARAADPLAPPAAKPPAEIATRAAKFDPATADAATAAGKDSATLQLGAFSTRDKAEAAWTKAAGDGALAGLSKRIEAIDRDGATLYRLRAGGVASKAAASALCGRLKAAGNACIVAE